MSIENYDVELPIVYDNEHRHYIPGLKIKAPRYYTSDWGSYFHDVFFSVDEESEEELQYSNYSEDVWSVDSNAMYQAGKNLISYTGIYNKAYFRNPNRNLVTFTTSNCFVAPIYQIKASFEIQWNLTGFAANTNASFRCGTVQKNTYKQYEWTSATVYYKESTDSVYQSVSGTITGTWSDYTISTNLSLQDGVIYDIYIVAISDDNETAQTPVAQFTTTDADAVATCISPSGAFTSGDVTFVWSHATEYGTPQYAYDLQYSNNNGGSWTTVGSHVVTPNTTATATLTDAGVYKWRVRTYNSNDVAGEWAEATFVNQVPANPPTNLQVNSKGRPTVTWASLSQSAYQVQFLLGDSIAYDSGAVYTSETSHFVNQYFNDTRSYTVRVRAYNALGEISEWVETGYQQPLVTDVQFTVETNENGGATITITEAVDFTKYFILRNNKPIALAGAAVDGEITYIDKYAIGLTNYGVVGVTSGEQSDIQTMGCRVTYPKASLIAQNGQIFAINKRVDAAYEVQTSNQADINKAQFIGDSYPTHYPSKMRLKTFTITCFDDQGIMEDLLGTLVFYADNFGNGGWCMVTAYDKTDNYVKNGAGAYANECSLTLEVTNYDDSIEYPL